ncbi:FMN-dependent NADH-azoreductase [Actinoplanes sp. SE50]|uniref:FMN-dependent NADH-azoreductase n=1 Tax=unclassified Actinoplanes TaxID=2626549 RepID=UPI00023ED5D1|nr:MULTISPECIES: NAD(P)H-dependent oxidoreductase [unclassified Actinoplanes]AEV83942.1 FMN-dependent NADH-azoreductase [Actinoplanes sp. SE50/110]ATO81914.1 FMN-dependent NADH-azoreductase [Actinoplanes sp. SE50]SLL99322.1 FMN-dependent NADH-azoreductase [Actinoplanes sp. SE50/110]
MKLLHIAASPRGGKSESLALAATFLTAAAEAHPGLQIEEWNLWDGTLPEFGPDAAAAKMAVFAGEQPQSPAWDAAVAAFHRFDAADRYLFSVPMWNAGVPYILKQFIDVVSQPGLVFGFDPAAGYTGLLRGKKAAVVYTSAVYGPDRPPAFGSDFQSRYFADWLHWAGVTDQTEIHFRPNLVTADAGTARKAAHAEAREQGRLFL